ncbi:MAG: DNA-3-methyladenine glycosylase [Ornithinimicrobium sp.]
MSTTDGPQSSATLRERLSGPVLTVARGLLGSTLVVGEVAIRVTEVEAYGGAEDPGSHAFRGPTRRSKIMFGEPGIAYVYFSYGMHHCLNVVCGPVGTAAAVLIRAGEVTAGEAAARGRRDRGRARPHPYRDLARGPARLASALGVDLRHNGADLCQLGGPVQLGLGTPVGVSACLTGPRVGVSGPGGDGQAYPWRFWLANEPTVSAYRPAVRTRPDSPVPMP